MSTVWGVLIIIAGLSAGVLAALELTHVNRHLKSARKVAGSELSTLLKTRAPHTFAIIEKSEDLELPAEPTNVGLARFPEIAEYRRMGNLAVLQRLEQELRFRGTWADATASVGASVAAVLGGLWVGAGWNRIGESWSQLQEPGIHSNIGAIEWTILGTVLGGLFLLVLAPLVALAVSRVRKRKIDVHLSSVRGAIARVKREQNYLA